jgi:hypothetical protein
VTNASNDARTSADTAEGGSTRTRRRASGASIKAGADAARTRIASLVWLVAVVCALFLAIGALLIALDANEKNAIVKFVLQGAGLLDGPFNRSNGVFTFAGKDAAVKDALVNWGIAAVVYLMIGKILDRLIRP